MKWAKSLIVLTGLAEGEVRADDFHNVGALPYPLDDIFRDQPFTHECPAGVWICSFPSETTYYGNNP
jgi:hypothetical protein